MENSNVDIFVSKLTKHYSDVIRKMDMKQFYSIAGEIIVSDIQENVFDKLGYGNNATQSWDGSTVKWPDISLSTKRQRMRGSKVERKSWPPPSGLILQRTGDLRASVFYQADSQSVTVSFSQNYGKYLHERFPFVFLTKSAFEEIQRTFILWAGKQMGG